MLTSVFTNKTKLSHACTGNPLVSINYVCHNVKTYHCRGMCSETHEWHMITCSPAASGASSQRSSSSLAAWVWICLQQKNNVPQDIKTWRSSNSKLHEPFLRYSPPWCRACVPLTVKHHVLVVSVDWNTPTVLQWLNLTHSLEGKHPVSESTSSYEVSVLSQFDLLMPLSVSNVRLWSYLHLPPGDPKLCSAWSPKSLHCVADAVTSLP